jgi:hypothetical protein
MTSLGNRCDNNTLQCFDQIVTIIARHVPASNKPLPFHIDKPLHVFWSGLQ